MVLNMEKGPYMWTANVQMSVRISAENSARIITKYSLTIPLKKKIKL